MKLRGLIEKYFLIDDAETGQLVPFIFRPVQARYYEDLCKDYSEEENFNGLREMILKARKEGFTSLILGLFAATMILSKHPIRFLEISYKDDATKQHFRRIKTFILSYYKKKTGIEDERRLEKQIFKSVNEGSEFVLAKNGASFYVGTASVRTGERGGTVQGCLFSEIAHYPDTGILNASEILEATRNMVAVGSGMIFLESTANSRNHFYRLWQQAKAGEVDYKPRFFSWKEFYTPEQFELIKAGFGDKRLIVQEYPDNDKEAFIASVEGKVFRNPRQAVKGKLRDPKEDHSYVMGLDLGKHKDFTSIKIGDRMDNHLCYSERFNIIEWPFQKKRIIAAARKYNNALVIPDVTGIGDPIVDDLMRAGVAVKPFLITAQSKREIIEKLSLFIEQKRISYPPIENMLVELENFGFEDRADNRYVYAAPTGFHDDDVIALALMCSELHEVVTEKERKKTLIQRDKERLIQGRQQDVEGMEFDD